MREDRSRTLVVVDDDQPTRDLLSEVLGDEGYEVAAADSAKDALRILAERPVDLIVLDLLLPDMGGRELAERYRANGGDAPIVLLSAAGAVREVARELDVPFVTKPFEVPVFLALVRWLLGDGGG